MHVGIIGAGFSGLAASLALQKKGHTVSLFEKDSQPGGLAVGYQEEGWEWSLEKHYHHWFTNDAFALGLAKSIDHEVIIKRPKTSVYVGGHSYQLDSPAALLQFQKLSLFNRLRMGAILGLLRYNPFWQPLEKLQAHTFLSAAMGKKGYEMIWEPQLKNKFGPYVSDMSLAWFWARIKKRTPSLAYPTGGFLAFAKALVVQIERNGGKLFFDTEVTLLTGGKKPVIETSSQKPAGRSNTFDKVIVTLPSFFFLKIVPDLPESYRERLLRLKGLGAINMVLRLKEQFLKDNTYWLSICEKNSPIMAIVEHTNFMDKAHYNNEHLVYLGNYLPPDHRYFKMSDEQLLKEYDPFLKRIQADYKKSLTGFKKFAVPFAQPIIPLNYSKIIPPFETPLANVYLANIQQVYPWDRGTNYAIELGEKVAKLAMSN